MTIVCANHSGVLYPIFYKRHNHIRQQSNQLIADLLQMDAHMQFCLLAIAGEDTCGDSLVLANGAFDSALHCRKADTDAMPLIVKVVDDAAGAVIVSHTIQCVVKLLVSLEPGIDIVVLSGGGHLL